VRPEQLFYYSAFSCMLIVSFPSTSSGDEDQDEVPQAATQQGDAAAPPSGPLPKAQAGEPYSVPCLQQPLPVADTELCVTTTLPEFIKAQAQNVAVATSKLAQLETDLKGEDLALLDAQAARAKAAPKKAAAKKAADTKVKEAEKAQKTARAQLEQARQELANQRTASRMADERLIALRGDLVKQKAALAALQTSRDTIAFSEHGCSSPLVLCLNREGGVLASDEAPTKIDAGDVLAVKVFTPGETYSTDVFDVSFSQRKALDVPMEPSSPTQRNTPTGLSAPDVAAVALTMAKYVASEPIDESTDTFTVTFSRSEAGKPAVKLVTVLKIPVHRGYSYYSVAFLVAVTPRGERQVHRDLSVTTNISIDPGFALNIFPGGRRRGVIGYFRTCGDEDILGWRCVADMVGVQVGADVDLTDPTDRLYAGLVVEPVAGLAFVGGVSLRQVAVVPPNADLPPVLDANDVLPVAERRVVRGYFGITMTLDLLDTISKVGAEIRKVKAP
jgi:hypothetical protein